MRALKNSRLNKRYRTLAYRRQGGCCYWCGVAMIVKTKKNGSWAWNHPCLCTADHLVLRAMGGVTVPENIVAACWSCNSRRHESANN